MNRVKPLSNIRAEIIIAVDAMADYADRGMVAAKIGITHQGASAQVALLIEHGYMDSVEVVIDGRRKNCLIVTMAGREALARHMRKLAGGPSGLEPAAPREITNANPRGRYSCHDLTSPAVRIGADDHMRIPSRVGDQLRYQYQRRHSHGGGASCQL